MRIHFFEEYPQGLGKAELLDFDTTVYIAARSLRGFHALRERVRGNPHVEAAYWPLLRSSYWLSPFSSSEDLERLSGELERERPLKVLLDLELPLLRPWRFLHVRGFPANRKRIAALLGGTRHQVLAAEYPQPWGFLEGLSGLLGLSGAGAHGRIPMHYTSFMPGWLRRRCERYLQGLAQSLGPRLQVGLGTIAKGVPAFGPLLTPAKLDRDLAFCRRIGVGTAVIYRLGGLNGEYLQVIRKHLEE